MDDPKAEIALAISQVAAASSADAQITAIEKFYTPDASFLHPLCYVPPSKGSRGRIASIYACYRGFIPRTSFDIQDVAWNEQTGLLFVKLVQRPEIRGLSWLVVPELPMRIHLHLRRDTKRWQIDLQEDLVQPRDLLLCLPNTRIFGIVFYWICEMMGILSAYIFAAIGLWSPSKRSRLAVD